jgi:heptosyltransferase-1
MPERILIVRMSAMGDLIQTTPLPRAIKAALPDAHVAWLAQSPFASLLEHNPHLDETIIFPHRRSGIYASALVETWARLKAAEFTIAVDPQGLAKSAAAVWITTAPWRIGKEEAREAAGLAYNDIIPERLDQDYVSQRYLELCEPFGASRDDYVPEIFLVDEDFGPTEELFAAEGLDDGRPLVALAPFAAEPRKEWPPESFITVADTLIDCIGARIIIPGAAGERERAEQIAARIKESPVVFAGRTNMRQAAAFLSRMNLFIGGESGLTHMAYAVGTPQVCIVGPTPLRNGPKGPTARTVFAEGIDCRPCRNRNCPHSRCLTEVTPEMVIEAALDLTSSSG